MTVHQGSLGSARAGLGKGPGIVQVAVLPWRPRKNHIEICLITSRGTGRWIVPKGWPMTGRSRAEAAAIEAWEEAGLKGTVSPEPLGQYKYIKQSSGSGRAFEATLFPMEVTEEADRYPECRDRKRIWLKPKKAAARLIEPQLIRMVRSFSPPKSKR